MVVFHHAMSSRHENFEETGSALKKEVNEPPETLKLFEHLFEEPTIFRMEPHSSIECKLDNHLPNTPCRFEVLLIQN